MTTEENTLRRALRPGLTRLAPGLGLALALTLSAWLLQEAERRLIGQAVIEALVIAIFLGMIWRNVRGVSAAAQPGVNFAAREVLEFAIVLLGASIDLPALLGAQPALLLAVLLLVCVGIAASMTIGRLIGLNPKLAILVAVGNAICGNSAIAAVAPVIRADKQDVASSIALTAILGVLMVLLLPVLIPIFGFSHYQYGVLAGMSVYAVPQVLAATLPVSALSGQVGTLVKLVRVLLLGPVIVFFTLLHPNPDRKAAQFSLVRFFPWFIVGFMAMAALRSLGLLPPSLAEPLREISRWLTVGAMAALGLGVDLRAVRQVGAPVAAAVIASLVVMVAVSAALIWLLGIG